MADVVKGEGGELLEARPVTQTGRLASLDVLRGFALLGILAMNVMVFAMPFAAYSNPTVFTENTGSNRVVYWIAHTVFDMKMMGLFSMLFGAGVVIWDRKRVERWGRAAAARAAWLAKRGGRLARCRLCKHDLSGIENAGWDTRCPECGRVQAEKPPYMFGTGLWMRRMCWLLVFGLVHGWLIWEGDILFAYAMTGMIALWWLRRLSALWLIVAACGFFAIHVLLSAGQGFQVWMLFSESQAAAQMRSNIPADQLDEMLEAMRVWMVPTEESLREQVTALRGDWVTVFHHRAEITLMLETQAFLFYLFWRAAAMMLLGAALVKMGVLTGERSSGFYAKLAIFAYAIGVPVTLAGIMYNESHGFDVVKFNTAGIFFNLIGSVPVMLGHAGLLLWIVKKGFITRLTFALSRVGQMAFTNYLMQSVLCSIIFYGWGFGMAGEMGRLGQEMVVVGIWLVEILWSIAWLSRFRFGPAEWLWRSLTYWKLQPMRRTDVPAVAAPA